MMLNVPLPTAAETAYGIPLVTNAPANPHTPTSTTDPGLTFGLATANVAVANVVIAAANIVITPDCADVDTPVAVEVSWVTESAGL